MTDHKRISREQKEEARARMLSDPEFQGPATPIFAPAVWEPTTESLMDIKLMESAIRTLLLGMGVRADNANFLDTPRRVARMYKELLTPQANNWSTFPAESSDLILLRGHRVVALCPHHLLPVEVTCHVGYIPNKLTLGLSKLARAVEQHLTIPIMQEDLAHAIAKTLDTKLEPKGVGVILSGVHGCMKLRGVESDGDIVVSVMRGVLLLNPTARSEFLKLVGRP
jgi:GTP cyclohydrolase I